jgi:hypothetical protein
MQIKIEFEENLLNKLLDNLKPDEIKTVITFSEDIVLKTMLWYIKSSLAKKNVKWYLEKKLLCDVKYDFAVIKKSI